VLLAAVLVLAYVPGLPLAAVAAPWLLVVPQARGVNDYLCVAVVVWGLADLLLLGPARSLHRAGPIA